MQVLSTCPVLVNTTTKQLETPDICWSQHPLGEQLAIGSSKESSSSPPCHLPWQECASLDTARVWRASQTVNWSSASPQQPLPGVPHHEGLAWHTLKAAWWKSVGSFLVGYWGNIWKISQSSQLHKQNQCQTGHYFKLESSGAATPERKMVAVLLSIVFWNISWGETLTMKRQWNITEES